MGSIHEKKDGNMTTGGITEKGTKQTIECWVCERNCRIESGKTGACGKYLNSAGEIRETAPDRYLTVCSISIETMPILHFRPRAKVLQITTTGCNFECEGCVSTMFVQEMDSKTSALRPYRPEEIVEKAICENCEGIAFVMNDPLASFFTFTEVARTAKKHGLLVGCSTNGYFTDTSLKRIAPLIDFINIGMKGFTDERYRTCKASGMEPVLRNIAVLKKLGVHIEISCIFERGMEQELEDLAYWLSHIDRTIPLQVMRFLPLETVRSYRETPISVSEELCRKLKSFLDYVYLFNSPGSNLLTTYCPSCGTPLVTREFYGPMGAKVTAIHTGDESECPGCGKAAAITGQAERPPFRESGFLGGYPFTRGLEIIKAALIASGVTEKRQVVSVWEKNIGENGLGNLHEEIASLAGYIGMIRRLGKQCGKEGSAGDLADYLERRCSEIADKAAGAGDKPRVCYIMGKPFFCLNPGRFENRLVELAGGIPVNNALQIEGRPGAIVPAQTISGLDPDVIFVSSFLSNPAEDTLRDCRDMVPGISAVRNKRIHTHPFHNIDFGSPRWILGLMHIANILHPHIFSYDLKKEANRFYNRFYTCSFNERSLNLSFAKPADNWKWEEETAV